MNFEYLNQMVKYIEENLTRNIEYKKLAKIVGVSEYNLQRIFVFLTNMSLAEYIRKRRLSKAFEELKTTDIKIIDLAVKYKYDSAISFTRAFKNMFGITPSECKVSNKEYKQYPIIKFNNNNDICKELNYEIKNIGEIKIYCVETSATTHEDLLYNIRKLYADIEENDLYKKFNKYGMYGIFVRNKNGYLYYVGSKEEYDNTKEFIIPEGRYVIFSSNSRNQKDIVKTEKMIYTQWLQSTNYDINDEFNFELYTRDNCYLYMLIKDKQNWFQLSLSLFFLFNYNKNKVMNKIKKICDELMKYGIKTQSIPTVDVWHFGEKTSHLNLEEYLNIKGIKLESLVLGEVLGEKSLEESR